ncbi:MAG TPA: hypothetical protein VFD04_23620 [Actinomycetes bacterium]|jgi:cell division protein FtsW (lipid II flippase)|nr:hypothetical protein [Actinomycetes bacterium]
MPYDLDPEQSVSIAAIFLFIDAAFLGFPVLQDVFSGGSPPPLAIALVAGLIAAGVGLLRGLRWSWWLAMVVVGLFALLHVLGVQLLALLIDALVLFLLTRPSTRARFGIR